MVGGFDAGRRRSFGSRRRCWSMADAGGSNDGRPFASALCCLIWPSSSPRTSAGQMPDDAGSVVHSLAFRARLVAL